MNDIIADRTDEWRQARCGKFTASRANLIGRVKTGKNKGKPTGECLKLLTAIAVERVTGIPQDDEFETYAMRRGREYEPEAKRVIEFDLGVTIEPVGFVEHPSLANVGASPDGRIRGQNRGLEIKMPMDMRKHAAALAVSRSSQHEVVDQLREFAPSIEYDAQIHWQAWCARYDGVLVCSYDPRFPASQQVAAIEVESTPAHWTVLQDRLDWAEERVAAIIKAMGA